MTTIYLTGPVIFGNRGSEALVRSTVTLLLAHLGPSCILVPVQDVTRSQAQWPEASDLGVEFVKPPIIPPSHVWWARLCRRLPFLTQVTWPGTPRQVPLEEHLARSDAVLSVGGDIFSLDYDISSPFFYLGIAERALAMGKPVVLWGASVGPFSKLPGVERQMVAHLKRLSLITVRESHSLAYLKQLGVSDNVLSVADPAFVMEPQVLDVKSFWPTAGRGGVLAINLSPLVENIRTASGAVSSIKNEAVRFIRGLIAETDLGVILVPHVAALDGSINNNDELYLAEILAETGNASGRVTTTPSGLNAAQLKYVISQCRYLIGARTHATIAALSTAVPTVSIAYSVKARGINKDLFGHERYVLPTAEVQATTLRAALQTLQDEETEIRAFLLRRLPEYRRAATPGAQWLRDYLASRASRLGKH